MTPSDDPQSGPRAPGSFAALARELLSDTYPDADRGDIERQASDVASAVGNARRLHSPISARRRRPQWESRLRATVILFDLLMGVVGTGAAFFFAPGYTLPIAAIGLLLLLLALGVLHAWEPTILGHGSGEFARLTKATAAATVGLSLGCFSFGLLSARPSVFLVLPINGCLIAVSRLVIRRELHRRRRMGRCAHKVLAVGSAREIANLIGRTRLDCEHGWKIVGACTPTGAGLKADDPHIFDIPVVSDLDGVAAEVRGSDYTVVAVSPTPGWTSSRLQQLAWDIEGLGVELIVNPILMEVAGPRLHVTPVDGLPMLRLTEPRFAGSALVVKAIVDRVGAALGLLIFSPFLLAVALAIKIDDGGPVIFRQARVGRNGKQFMMLKFRSMVVDAGLRKSMLDLAVSEHAGPLFKLRSDPRITRVGAVMRKFSIDEFPQLLNVLAGSMSLVGPRPPLPDEIATYSRDARRKLLLKPGMTGLWQISGRADLSWEESVRLDLRYVENWSLSLDLLILWKTFGAVLRGSGAY